MRHRTRGESKNGASERVKEKEIIERLEIKDNEARRALIPKWMNNVLELRYRFILYKEEFDPGSG